MKKKYVQGILFGVLFATAVSCSACGGKKDEAKKSGETVNAKENVVKKKEAVKLVLSEAKSLPDKVKDAEFSSADKKIATVTKNGVVHGVKRGKTTITMKSDKEVIHYQIKVAKHGMVYPKFTMLTGEHLDMQFSTKVKAKNVRWSSTNKKIATINKKGKIVAKKRGNVIIKGNDGKRTYVSKITVKKRPKNIVYLTFDDGPSVETTPKILETLRKNNIKATFFVLGSNVEKSDTQKELLKEMVKEGHAIGNHGYCHDYSILYPGRVADTTVFINDMEKSENVMKSVLGDSFSTKVIRFPGGHMSWKTGDLDKVLEQDGYTYIDWNVLNGDAESNGRTVEQLINRLKETVTDLAGNDDVLVILMHDTDAKVTTAESLQQSIDYLKSLGYEFRTLK